MLVVELCLCVCTRSSVCSLCVQYTRKISGVRPRTRTPCPSFPPLPGLGIFYPALSRLTATSVQQQKLGTVLFTPPISGSSCPGAPYGPARAVPTRRTVWLHLGCDMLVRYSPPDCVGNLLARLSPARPWRPAIRDSWSTDVRCSPPLARIIRICTNRPAMSWLRCQAAV